RQLLEALVRKHLERHSDDAVQSLASVGSLGSTRKDLEQIRDPGLQASLAQVAARTREWDPDATQPPAAVGTPTAAGLRFRVLRGQFIDVCETVAYAHSRRVLHRDLKPANVMLGKYGETLVVDWGLAQPLDPAGAENTEGPVTPVSLQRMAIERNEPIGTL